MHIFEKGRCSCPTDERDDDDLLYRSIEFFLALALLLTWGGGF